MESPYRSSSAPPGPPRARPTVVAQSERPPTRAIRVRELSDGTTMLRLLRLPGPWEILPSLLFVLFLACTLASLLLPSLRDKFLFVAAPEVDLVLTAACVVPIALIRGVRVLQAERIVITPAALVRRRGLWRRPDVAALDEISTVVLSGSGRVDVQLGRQRLQILGELGYTEAELRWCAQRLRRAIDSARAARTA